MYFLDLRQIIVLLLICICVGCSSENQELQLKPIPILKPITHYAFMDSSKYGILEASLVSFEDYSQIYELLRYKGESRITDYHPILLDSIRTWTSEPIINAEDLIVDSIMFDETTEISEQSLSLKVGNNKETFSHNPDYFPVYGFDELLRKSFLSSISDSICANLLANINKSIPQRFLVKVRLTNRFNGGISSVNPPELHACFMGDYYRLDDSTLIGSNTSGRGRFIHPGLQPAEDGAFYYILPDIYLIDLSNPIFSGISSTNSEPIKFQLRIDYIVDSGVIEFTDHLFASTWNLEKIDGEWILYNDLLNP